MRYLVIICLFVVSSCSLPRGAALQSEIIGGKDKETADYAVYAVSKETLPIIMKWPAPNNSASVVWPGKGVPYVDKVIRPFDRVDVIVWDSEENSLLSSVGQKTVNMPNMQVSSAGTIFLPFVGAVHVAGLAQPAARSKIQRKYESVIPTAQVQLKVKQGTRGTVSMVSGVHRPGPIVLDDPNTTLLNVISVAGGPAGNLRNPQVRLLRNGHTYRRPYSDIVENSKYDVVMRAGDKVAVEKDARYFRSLGAAAKESIVPFGKAELSALDAMSMVGGLSDARANPKGILILREYGRKAVRSDDRGPDNERSVFVIDLTSADGLFSAGKFKIHDQDTVLVTESSVASASVVLRLINQITSAAVDLNGL